MNDVVVISARSKIIAEKYFAPFTALSYANELKKEGHEVLLVFDDIVEHYTKELLIFNTVDQPFVSFEKVNKLQGPLNIINEMFVSTGVSEKGSLSTIIIYDKFQANREYEKSAADYYKQIESLADSLIEFNLADPLYRSNLR